MKLLDMPLREVMQYVMEHCTKGCRNCVFNKVSCEMCAWEEKDIEALNAVTINEVEE